MSPRRVFKGDPHRPDQLYGITSTGEIKEGELTLFQQETRKLLPDKPFRFLDRLSKIPPARRLAMNMKSLMDLMGQKEVTDVLREGLTEQERSVLIDLQVRDAAPRMKEIAHALLCIDERIAFVERMGSVFKTLITKKGGYIQNGQHGS